RPPVGQINSRTPRERQPRAASAPNRSVTSSLGSHPTPPLQRQGASRPKKIRSGSGQRDPEERAAFAPVGRGQAAAEPLHDAGGDREAQAGARLLGGEEGLEDVGQ